MSNVKRETDHFIVSLLRLVNPTQIISFYLSFLSHSSCGVPLAVVVYFTANLFSTLSINKSLRVSKKSVLGNKT